MQTARERWTADYRSARLVKRFHDVTYAVRRGDLLSLAHELPQPLFDAAWRQARGLFNHWSLRQRLAFQRDYGIRIRVSE